MIRGQFSTGIVLVSGYAKKGKRVIFAQLKDAIKSGMVDRREVAFKIGMLNRLLFEVVVGELQLDKHDVVRVRLEYTVENGELNWDYDTLQIEVWRFNEAESNRAVEVMKKLVKEAEFMRDLELEAELAGRNALGEEIYVIKRGDEVVGAIKAIKVNDSLLVVGAIREPPRMIKATMPGGMDVPDMLTSILARSIEAEPEEVEKAISDLLEEIEK